MTEVLLRFFQQKASDSLFRPAQGKLHFHDALPAFTAIANTNTVFRNIRTGFGTRMRARTDAKLAGLETLINVGQLLFMKQVILLTRGILHHVSFSYRNVNAEERAGVLLLCRMVAVNSGAAR